MDSIVFDCERLKYPCTGLYSYCHALGNALLREVNPATEKLHFYVNKNNRGIFGDSQDYFLFRNWHRFVLKSPDKYKIWHLTNQLSNYLPRTNTTKLVITVHDLNFLIEKKNSKKQAAYLSRLQYKINAASDIVCISQFVLNDVKKHLHTANARLHVIYNGCNPLAALTAQQPAYVPNVPFLFTIGMIAAKKNFHVLPCLLHNTDFQLIIAGITHSDSYKDEIIAEARKWGVEDRVVFVGGISEADKSWYYENCTAFVFPSIAEGFGLPVVEAMQTGRPVFLSTHTSLPEIGGEAAYYFNDLDPQQMQQTLSDGLHHYETEKPASLIRQRAAKFNWATAAQQYLKIYKD